MNYIDALNYGNEILKTSNIRNYKLDSELLLAKVLNKTREELIINFNNKIESKKFYEFKKLLVRRKQNEPIAYIFKTKEFWRSNFKINNDL